MSGSIPRCPGHRLAGLKETIPSGFQCTGCPRAGCARSPRMSRPGPRMPSPSFEVSSWESHRGLEWRGVPGLAGREPRDRNRARGQRLGSDAVRQWAGGECSLALGLICRKPVRVSRAGRREAGSGGPAVRTPTRAGPSFRPCAASRRRPTGSRPTATPWPRRFPRPCARSTRQRSGTPGTAPPTMASGSADGRGDPGDPGPDRRALAAECARCEDPPIGAGVWMRAHRPSSPTRPSSRIHCAA
jgi:hypothetical protein